MAAMAITLMAMVHMLTAIMVTQMMILSRSKNSNQ
jgi:hypothetical protein